MRDFLKINKQDLSRGEGSGTNSLSAILRELEGQKNSITINCVRDPSNKITCKVVSTTPASRLNLSINKSSLPEGHPPVDKQVCIVDPTDKDKQCF